MYPETNTTVNPGVTEDVLFCPVRTFFGKKQFYIVAIGGKRNFERQPLACVQGKCILHFVGP